MNAFEKEKVYEKLRNYHTDKFPEKIENPYLDDLRNKYGDIEDKVIVMILRFANNKESYVDLTGELEAFKTQQMRHEPGSNDDKNILDLLTLKLSNLTGIMLFAKDA